MVRRRIVHGVLAMLLAVAFLVVETPGLICFCHSPDDAACGRDACQDEGVPGEGDGCPGGGGADRDCAQGCAVICCAHLPFTSTSRAPVLELRMGFWIKAKWAR